MADLRNHMSAITDSLKRASAALREAEVPAILGGGLAVWARGGPETLHDLDFMVKPEDAERALDALAGAGMRPERPPEGWLYKAWDGDVCIDLIFEPRGLAVTDEVIDRAEDLEMSAISLRAMALEDVLTTKLLALDEHSLDYEGLLQMARAVREQVDWGEVHARTSASPFARAFFGLLDGLGIAVEPSAPGARGNVRVISEGA